MDYDIWWYCQEHPNATGKEVADAFGITTGTLYQHRGWKERKVNRQDKKDRFYVLVSWQDEVNRMPEAVVGEAFRLLLRQSMNKAEKVEVSECFKGYGLDLAMEVLLERVREGRR